MTTDWTIDELLVCYMARQIKNEDFMVQGMGTPLVFSAFLLAKATHASQAQFMYTVGNTISQHSGRLTLNQVETNTMERALRFITMPQMHLEIVPSLYAKEFMRPAQIDQYGNTNNVVIGDYQSPRVRLPGSAGIGDVCSFNYNIYFYVTQHSKRTLVKQLDFCSSVGYGERQRELAKMGEVKRGPQQLITDKCIFEFSLGKARMLSIHPYVTLDDVKQNTGFDFDAQDTIPVTEPPTVEELTLLREQIDPYQLRRLEFLSGKERLDHIERILHKEKSIFA